MIILYKSAAEQEAARKLFGKDASFVESATSLRTFSLLENNSAHAGMLTIDNNLSGTKYHIYDHFIKHETIHINAEIVIKEPDDSYSRIISISQYKKEYTDGNKASFVFVVSHKPGSLYNALAIFENYELNLTKIESRPLYNDKYDYYFYVDFQYNQKQYGKMEEIISVFKENTQYLRIIGYYTSTNKTL